MAQRPQYKMLTSTSKGAEHTESTFLTPNRAGLKVKSARRPNPNVAVANASPIIVKNWKFPPNPSCKGVGKARRYAKLAEKERSPRMWTTAEKLLEGEDSR
jgi:hypothetical protein